MDNFLALHSSKWAQDYYRENCRGKEGSRGGIFPQMSDMFFWCIAFSYNASPVSYKASSDGKSKLPSLEDRGVEIRFNAFTEEMQKDLLKMIAVETYGSFDILNGKQNDEFRKILEGYAENGLDAIVRRLECGRDYHLDPERLMALLIDKCPELTESPESP